MCSSDLHRAGDSLGWRQADWRATRVIDLAANEPGTTGGAMPRLAAMWQIDTSREGRGQNVFPRGNADRAIAGENPYVVVAGRTIGHAESLQISPVPAATSPHLLP